MKKSKRYREAKEALKADKEYTFDEALEVLEKFPKAKFDESVEVHVKLGIDPKKTDQQVRATIDLPHGTGGKAKVIAAVTTAAQEEAKKAGAEIVGAEELIDKIIAGKAGDFDVLVATPEVMPKLAKAAKILGPKGLMPNPKNQTVGPKITELIEGQKKGRASFKNDKGGNIHQIIGKRSFGKDQLKENYDFFIKELNKSKPQSVKSQLIKKISVCSTMSPGLTINS